MSSPAERTRCPYCGKPAGKPCTTPSGKPTNTHSLRWDAYRARWRSEEMIVEMIGADAQFGLLPADRLLVVAYPYDAKVTVIQRISDGHSPECNQYSSDVRFIGFVEDQWQS